MTTKFKSFREIEVEAAGVVNVGYDNITINSEDALAALRHAIEKANPAMNYNGDFAGRVTVSIELLGDIEEPQETTPCCGEGGGVI